MTNNKNKTSIQILLMFLSDSIIAALLFIGIFLIAIVLSELLYYASTYFNHSEIVFDVSIYIKYFMLGCDGILLCFYLISHLIHALRELKFFCKDYKNV